MADWRTRQRLSTLGLLAALAAAVYSVTALNERFDARRQKAPPETVLYLPKGRSFQFMCLGYNGIAADLVWIRSVMYAGRQLRSPEPQSRERKYQWLEKLYQVTTDLDPHWSRPYRAGAILLAALPQDDLRAVNLLRRGMGRNPWDWEIPFQAAQLDLLRGRNREALGYLKLMSAAWERPCARLAAASAQPRPAPAASGLADAEARHWLELMQAYPKIVTSTISRLEQEGQDYASAVADAAAGLSRTDDQVIREVLGRTYREALARLVVEDLSRWAGLFRASKRRAPADLRELLATKFAKRDEGRPATAVPELLRLELAPRLGPELAASTAAHLPADPLGMEFYLRPDGTVSSRGLERLELIRLLATLNHYLGTYQQARGGPARSLDDLLGYLRWLADNNQLGAGARAFFKYPPRLPPHPSGSPEGWKAMPIKNGRLELPPGPSAEQMFAAPLKLPPGPGEPAQKKAGGGR